MFTWAATSPRQDTAGNPFQEHVADFVMVSKSVPEESIDSQGRLRTRYGPPINYMVQRGHIYLNGGEEVSATDVPDWFWTQYRLITPSTRRLVGLKLPEDIQTEAAEQIDSLTRQFASLAPELQEQLKALIAGKAPRIDEKAPKISAQYVDMGQPSEGLKNDPEAPRLKLWTCDRCGEETLLSKKGVHLAAHGRADKRAAAKGN